MTGRPSIRTETITDDICARLSKGEPLAVICRDEGMPSPGTVRRWMEEDAALSEAIARAREEGEDSIAADCLLIADDASGDFRMGEKGVLADTDHIQRSKLRIDTRLKLLAKFNPKRWGDKLELAGNAEQPLAVVIQRKATDPEAQP